MPSAIVELWRLWTDHYSSLGVSRATFWNWLVLVVRLQERCKCSVQALIVHCSLYPISLASLLSTTYGFLRLNHTYTPSKGFPYKPEYTFLHACVCVERCLLDWQALASIWRQWFNRPAASLFVSIIQQENGWPCENSLGYRNHVR